MEWEVKINKSKSKFINLTLNLRNKKYPSILPTQIKLFAYNANLAMQIGLSDYKYHH